jgi:RHS repeat-associated protein
MYVWDLENRLTAVTQAGAVVEYAYDADGNRIQTRVTPPTGPPIITDYLVDSSGSLSHVVVETNHAGTVLATYVRAADDLLALIRPGPTTTSRWYHADGLNSIRLLTNESGGVTDTYTHSAFGELLEHIGADAQPYAFAGEPYDPNVGFAYHRARWLDPGVGRFISEDPFAGLAYEPTTLHAYLYARNEPTDRRDPSGLFDGGLAGLSIASSIQNTLASIQSISGQALIQAAQGDSAGAWQSLLLGAGGAVIAAATAYVAVKLISAIVKAFRMGASLAGKVALVSKIRSVLNVSRGKNIAIANAELDDVVRQYVAISGEVETRGNVGAPAVREFQTFVVNGFSRAFDAEVKILEDLAARLTPTSRGTVELFSDFPICSSCQEVIRQFEEKFPYVRLMWSGGR